MFTVERRYQLLINLKAKQALGLDLSLRPGRADEVIAEARDFRVLALFRHGAMSELSMGTKAVVGGTR